MPTPEDHSKNKEQQNINKEENKKPKSKYADHPANIKRKNSRNNNNQVDNSSCTTDVKSLSFYDAAVKAAQAAEAADSLEAIYVFDPSHEGGVLKTSLERGNMAWRRQIRRELFTLRNSTYQIVYVTGGIMDKEERERSKILIGQSDTQPIANIRF